MNKALEKVLGERGAVPAILFIHAQRYIHKYDLRVVMKSQKLIEKTVALLASAGIIWTDSISCKNRKEYRIGLTEFGRTIADNLEKVDGSVIDTTMYSRRLRDLLVDIYVSGAKAIVDLPRRSIADDMRKLLLDLDWMGYIRLDRRPSGAPDLSSPVPFVMTSKGKIVASALAKTKDWGDRDDGKI